jgi:hypothetical protein
MTNRKPTSNSANAIEKVELTENLLKCYSCAVDPTAEELIRAVELGIDIEALKEVKGGDDAASY